MKKAETVLRDALAMTGMVIPITSNGRGGKVEFLCRQVPGQETRWLGVVEGLLRWGDQELKDKLFIARRYLLKDNKMVFGWFVSVDAVSSKKLQDVSESMAKYMELLQKEQADVPATPVPVTRPQTRSPVGPNAPRIKVLRQGVDDEGRPFEETEMPLPHVPKDLNTPSKPIWNEAAGRYIGGGRGAKYSGAGR